MTPTRRLIVRRPCADDLTFPADLHPVLVRIYRARRLSTVHELDRSFERMLSPSQLKGIDGAVELLVEQLRNRGRLLVVADFDFMQIKRSNSQAVREDLVIAG
ncbi:MAG: hypothetical protein HY308_10190 [Gammaproteobacteria bacterium]|nr:hypothetical protein [Gammaproteobacteria bacterium]